MKERTDPNPYPKPWEASELLGHQWAEEEFNRAIQQNKLAHAWLITGMEGIGKATLAYRLTQILLSSTKKDEPLFSPSENLFDENTPLDRRDDPIYRQIASRTHPNMRVVERRVNEKTGKLQGEISVDDIRLLGDFMRLTADPGDWRVVIIDSIDDLNRNAANALLKSLEEPRPHTLLLLISHNSGRLLPTIRSRCRQLALSPLKDQDILAHLPSDLSEEDRGLILSLASGSLGKALRLLQNENLQTFRSVWSVLLQWPHYDMNELHRLADILAERNNEAAFEGMIDFLRWWWWRFSRFYAGASLQPILPHEEALAQRWKTVSSLEAWMQLWEKIVGIFARVDYANSDRRLAFLNAMLEIGAISRKRAAI